MEARLLRFILRYSRREQILLLVMTLSSFPFLYYSLELPKLIINRAIGGTDFPKELFGFELEQIPFLLALCGIFLALVLLNGGFKYVINVYRGVVGERMLRRLRYQLYRQVLRFPLPQFRRMSQGEIVSMITGETEHLGEFIGDSIALPAFQGGTLLTILVFMFAQDWKLGLAAVALYPLQMYLIPKLQRRVNQLRKQRVLKVRKLSERIGEVSSSVRDVHAHDTSQFELADYSQRMSELYDIRVAIYRWKFLIKFLNNFIAQITPFFFFSIGGWLVIRGDLTFGALVAVLAAYKDLSAPWKELLDYYQNQADARIKYELLAETFQPSGVMDAALLDADPPADVSLLGPLVASNLDLREEPGEHAFDSTLTVRIPLPQRVALVGAAGSGAERLALAAAGLLRSHAGGLTLNGVDLVAAPESVVGRRVSYVGQEPHLYSASLRDNLLYSLKHRPVREAEYTGEAAARHAQWLKDSRLAGNSDFDINADWVDYATLGVDDPAAVSAALLAAVRIADLDQDVYQFGLQGNIDISLEPELTERFLAARNALRERLDESENAQLVEVFDRDRYNTNMTVAENLLFGTPRDPSLDLDNLAANTYVRKVLHEAGLMDDFLAVGRKLAALMVDLFADVSPDSDLFEQFSFISADDLPGFRALLARTEGGRMEALERSERIRLLSLPFKLSPARHRLGLIEEEFQKRLLRARQMFATGFGEGSPDVAFFDRGSYNSSLTVQDNILFGRLVYGRARASAVIGRLLVEVVEELGLRDAIMEVGLHMQVGVGGARLGSAQRLKASIARAVIKRPDLLLVDRATAALDHASQRRILRNLLEEFRERGLIWVVHHASLAEEFDHVVVMQGGRAVGQGRFSEVNRPGSILRALVDEG